ncbi:bifunctional metallophosphatase/5'-nucleotidase [Bombilactobacillus thymidiniphilus]|uniref:Metallophosphoesterase n=1 Tax=Bombilactobacillus thymidiniphilus TaxID=2923363 RepID=A0ABY4PDS9_9LACO|nr:bifunctional metallophosphatase/5'-nucleotidase [Bombilactobacillus thymidiniphilus]UQS83876.1 metallophosphoesterase [Bombilactobacillus thymidiniphilus]
MSEKIQLLHTNDLHSHFENFPQIKRYFQDQRQANQKLGNSTLILDIGDAADRQHPLTEATMARANIAWMSDVGYDAVTIGNSEGLYFAHQTLEQMYQTANFPVVLSNLYEMDGSLANFAQSYKIMTTPQHTKVGLLGLTAPYTLTYPLLNWQVKTVEQVLPRLIKLIRPQVDVLILLSHLGLPADRQLATTYPQLDVIIGGHTHHLLRNGEVVNGVLLAAVQKFGHYVGKIDLELQNHQLITKNASTIEVATLPSQAQDAQMTTKVMQQGENLLKQQKIANLPFKLTKNMASDNSAIKITLQAMKEATGCSAAMVSSGLFLDDLPQGIVTAADLHRQLPHAIHLMKTKLQGCDFWRFIMEVEKNRNFLRNFPQKGMGFRGKIFGEIAFSGVEFDSTSNTVFYLGKPIVKDQTYEIALLDHYYFIPFFPTLQIMGVNQFEYPDFLRSVLSKYLARHFPL